ncbi:MAG: extensin family protein [Aliihoeflea sp.]|uniref:extensin family protein n=1 Tax=Aliihoeflea sp. TaxID=2608088 RepID=UPI004033D916
MRPFLIPVFPALMLLSASAFAQQGGKVDLPDAAPVPQELPEGEREPDVPQTEDPESAAEPADPQESGEVADEPQELPETQAAPLPSPRPDAPESPEPDAAVADEVPVDAPRSRQSTAMPSGEIACRARLRELGVAFEEHPPQSEPEGCKIAHPLTVSSLGGGVALEPEGVMNCAIAEANARFVRDQAQQQAARHLSARIAAVNQVSAYICRPRHGTRKLSEHAFGNALDWGAVVLEDERRIDVRAYRRGSPEATFFAAMRKSACGPFTTVLGPGSDADHADHFHFDLAERSNGSTYCR